MKTKRTRILAFLLVCAIGVTCGACGKSGNSTSGSDSSGASNSADSNAADGSSMDEAEVSEILEENRKLQVEDYSLSDGSSDVPVNEGVTQNSSSSSDSSTGSSDSSDSGETSYVVVTDDSGATVTDTNGNTVTSVVQNNSSSNGSANSSSSSGNGTSSTTESSSSGSSGNSSSYTASLKCKQFYWIDTSAEGDFDLNGEFLDVTFKIKDSAPDGNYTIGFASGSDASEFANYDATDVEASYIEGDVAVGSATAKSAGSAGSDFTVIAGTASGNQGDEVTIRYNMANCPGICAMILRITYDENALEYVSSEVGADCADVLQMAE